MQPSRIASFAAGLLVANAAPHLATAVTGRRHLTPLAGRDSRPVVNGAWSALNDVRGELLIVSEDDAWKVKRTRH